MGETIDPLFQQAQIHHQAGRFAEAEAIYRQIILQQPQHADALHWLGVLAMQTGRLDWALELIPRAIALQPRRAHFYAHLGLALQSAGRGNDAAEAFGKALALQPDFTEAQFNLATLYLNSGRPREAEEAYRKLLRSHPHHLQSLHNLGDALLGQQRLDDAIDLYRRALAFRGDAAMTHWNLAIALLMKGDFLEGWREYEWRWKVHAGELKRPDFPQPAWEGEELSGRRILLYSEQGFGDSIQFVRYLPMVAERGGKIILQAPRALCPVFESLRKAEIIPAGRDLPPFDAHCSLVSLPRIFQTTLQSVPAKVPYLPVDPDRRACWGARVPGDGRLKVGLVWAGSAAQLGDEKRSISPDRFAPLGKIPRVWFCSLQKGRPAAPPPAGLEVADWTNELNDFADSAALLANLDLLITVDTSAAHLAGAIGLPVWILLQHFPDWRWMLNRDDSPWYPTARLFRQQTPGDWDGPIHRVTAALSGLVAEKRS
jgi:tetratricopeptide (TPR) repeat protein